MADSEKHKYKTIDESVSLASSFRMGAYFVGMQDLILGVVGLIAVVNQMRVTETRMPLFGQYSGDHEVGHRWSPPPEHADNYMKRNIVQDPYRMQFVIIAMVSAAGGMILSAILLILGTRYNRSWLIRSWLYPNYFLMLTHAIFMIVIGCYPKWAVYALMAGPVLAWRVLLVWLVYVYDRAISFSTSTSSSKLKKKDLESFSCDSSMDYFSELNFESTTPSQVHSSRVELPEDEVDSGAAFSSDTNIDWDTIRTESLRNGVYTKYDSSWDSIPEHQSTDLPNEEFDWGVHDSNTAANIPATDDWSLTDSTASKPDTNEDFYSLHESDESLPDEFYRCSREDSPYL